MGKDTKIDFLPQILKKLWGIEYLVHTAQTASLFVASMTEKLLKGAGSEVVSFGVALFWLSFIWYAKYK